MKIFRGLRADGHARVEVSGTKGRFRTLPLKLELRNHSPTGFEWGYAGSGPAQLALAICADVLGDDEHALAVYQRFKDVNITNLPRDRDFMLTEKTVRDAIAHIDRELREGRKAK